MIMNDNDVASDAGYKASSHRVSLPCLYNGKCFCRCVVRSLESMKRVAYGNENQEGEKTGCI
jgi:hypothetical protein